MSNMTKMLTLFGHTTLNNADGRFRVSRRDFIRSACDLQQTVPTFQLIICVIFCRNYKIKGKLD